MRLRDIRRRDIERRNELLGGLVTVGRISGQSTHRDVGEARESIAVKYRGKDFAAAYNPEYLMDPLRNLPDDEVHFDFVDDTSPGVLRVSSSSFLYVIMPMRMA